MGGLAEAGHRVHDGARRDVDHRDAIGIAIRYIGKAAVRREGRAEGAGIDLNVRHVVRWLDINHRDVLASGVLHVNKGVVGSPCYTAGSGTYVDGLDHAGVWSNRDHRNIVAPGISHKSEGSGCRE